MDNDKRYLQALIAEGEHEHQDFKYKVTDAEKLAKSVSAFANTDGGRLLIGVRDDGHLSGVRSEEEIYMMHAAAYKYCKPESSISFETLHADGRTIVIATVPKSKRRPICVANISEGTEKRPRAYIRIADENIVASPVHLEIWKQEGASTGTVTCYSDDERAVMQVLDNSPELPLNRIVKLSKVHRRKVIVILAKLTRFGLTKIIYRDNQFYFSAND